MIWMYVEEFYLGDLIRVVVLFDGFFGVWCGVFC